MKTTLIILLTAALMLVGIWAFPSPPESTEDQSARLSQELWKLETQFAMNRRGTATDLTVVDKRVWEMQAIGCEDAWGCSNIHTGLIAILYTRDMPQAMPQVKRIPFQNEVLQHELMHFEFEHLGVPPEVQDKLIHALQPFFLHP